MHPTRRFWTAVGVAGVLAAVAIIAGRPVLLLGTAAIAALLVFRQWWFLVDARDADEGLAIDFAVGRTYVRTGEETPVTLSVGFHRPTAHPVTVSVPTPLLAGDEGPDLAVTIPAGERRASATGRLSWPTAGTATFERATVSIESNDGLFVQSFPRGPTPTVVVEPRAPREVHVGQGGDRTDAAFGAHRSGELGTGIDPAELREYVPGDDVGDIDWKATARHGEAYVREYEVETDRRTVFLFDHRATMAAGPPGESKLAYLRELALALAASAEELGDPLGLYAVGDGGLTAEFSPGTTTEGYRAIRDRLHDLEPTTDDADRGERAVATGTAAPHTGTTDPEAARKKAAALAGDDSAFATRVRPFLQEGPRYLRRIEGEPLYDVARTYVDRLDGQARTILFTDDADRVQVREAVKAARSGTREVVVYLAPTALFEEGGMGDLEATYERYVDFESFRRELAGIDRVSAYEVAPGDRMEAVLAAGRRRR